MEPGPSSNPNPPPYPGLESPSQPGPPPLPPKPGPPRPGPKLKQKPEAIQEPNSIQEPLGQDMEPGPSQNPNPPSYPGPEQQLQPGPKPPQKPRLILKPFTDTIEYDTESCFRELKIVSTRLLNVAKRTSKKPNESEKKVVKRSAISIVKNFFRPGRREISDEEQGLLEEMYESQETDLPPSPTSGYSGGIPHTMIMDKAHKCTTNLEPLALEAAELQICVKILEVRQVSDDIMDPVACVEIEDTRKYTSAKPDSNYPYYNEHFMFHFYASPAMLLDKIITISVQQSRNPLLYNEHLGIFKIDVATVWSQPNKQFYHQWVMLTDPDDMSAGAKGYLKCDISVIAKGKGAGKIQRNSDTDDDFVNNLLLPTGVLFNRQLVRHIIKIYKADGLPKVNYFIWDSVKQALTAEKQVMIDPYVTVSFGNISGRTAVIKNTNAPVWNTQIAFMDLVPSPCQRIKIQLRDNLPKHLNIIGTHFIDFKTISREGIRGLLPNLGPHYIYMYGQTRDLNVCMQEEGYRVRMLISVQTEIIDNIEIPTSRVEISPTTPINEALLERNEQFFLFACVTDGNIYSNAFNGQLIQFELSIGSAGNTTDGQNESVKRVYDLDKLNNEEISPDIGYWQSTTPPVKLESSTDKLCHHLPYGDTKPCMQVRSVFPGHRRRLYNYNALCYIVDKLEDGINSVEDIYYAWDSDRHGSRYLTVFKSVLKSASVDCDDYAKKLAISPSIGNTHLDEERHKKAINNIEHISYLLKGLRRVSSIHTIKDNIRNAYGYVRMIKVLLNDMQQDLPDIFIWMLASKQRVAYFKISPSDIVYSARICERGHDCGKIKSLSLKFPGDKSIPTTNRDTAASLKITMLMGGSEDKIHFLDSLPEGHIIPHELELVPKYEKFK